MFKADAGTDRRFLEWLCTVSSCSILAVSRRISASSSRCVWSTCWQSRAKVVAISLGMHTEGKDSSVSSLGLGGWGATRGRRPHNNNKNTFPCATHLGVFCPDDLLLDLVAAVGAGEADDKLQLFRGVVHKLALQAALLGLGGPRESLVHVEQAVQ